MVLERFSDEVYFVYFLTILMFSAKNVLCSSSTMVKQRQIPVSFSYLPQGMRSKSKLFDQGLHYVLRNKRL